MKTIVQGTNRPVIAGRFKHSVCDIVGLSQWVMQSIYSMASSQLLAYSVSDDYNIQIWCL